MQTLSPDSNATKIFSNNHGNLMTKATISIAKAGKIPAGIMDITKIPDIALWSKQVTTGNVTKVGMPVTQGIISIEKSPSAIDDLNTTNISNRADIDPANRQEMSSVINSDLSLMSLMFWINYPQAHQK